MGFLEEGSESRRRPWRPGRRAATAFCAEGTAKAKAPGSGKRSADSRAGNTKHAAGRAWVLRGSRTSREGPGHLAR